MRSFCLKSIFLAYIIQFSSYVYGYNINQQSASNLASVYGYAYGQNYTLDQISSKFPELRNDVYFARMRFNSKFPNLQENTEQLINSIGSGVANQEINKHISYSIDNLSLQIHQMSKIDAQNYINEVNRRSQGYITSPILENILSIQYDNHPEKEMANGFYQSYSSKGHAKTKGIVVNLKLPKSWKKQEAERPNIVNKWVSQNGSSALNVVMLAVKNLPPEYQNYNFTRQDIQEMYDNGEIYTLASEMVEGFDVVDIGSPITLEGQQGFHFTVAGSLQRLNIQMYQIMDMYNIFYNGKMISINCYSGNLLQDAAKTIEKFPKYKSMCQSIANSLVLPQKYQ